MHGRARGGRRSVLRILAAAALAISGLSPKRASAAQDALAQKPVRILVLGDSLTAGYGLDDLNQAFPAQLQRALKEAGDANVTIVSGGISGDTTTGGLSRLEWSLGSHPDGVIVELGGNDGLRAIDPKLTEDNVRAIVTRLQKAGVPVLLAGMLAPPNLGRDYDERFAQAFRNVAKDTGVLFYPFFLEGVAGVPELNQADRIHPTPKGVAVIVARILPSVQKLIAAARAH